MEEEQNELFRRMVDAFRSVSRDERQPFLFSTTFGRNPLLTHKGLGKDGLPAYEGDLAALVEAGYLRVRRGSQGVLRYDVTNRGSIYYDYLQTQRSAALETVEDEVVRFMDSGELASRFPEAHAQWTKAARLLWGPESNDAATQIGHLCREAMQHFADTLAQHMRITVESPPTHTVDRIRAAVRARPPSASSAIAAFSDALLAYWGTVSNLVQRQEHGALKEGEELGWEDSRRVVFQTGVVMFEIQRLCLTTR